MGVLQQARRSHPAVDAVGLYFAREHTLAWEITIHFLAVTLNLTRHLILLLSNM